MSDITKMVKKCITCGEIKSILEFPKRKDGKDGFRNACKGCQLKEKRIYREYNKERIKKVQKFYNKKHKEKIKIRNRLYHDKNRVEILAKQKIYYKKNREYFLAYKRKTTLGSSNGRIYNLNKRDYPGYCELCGDNNIRLVYHHWDDSNPSKGIWMCHFCHMLVTGYERKKLLFIRKYFKLKKSLNEESETKNKLKQEIKKC